MKALVDDCIEAASPALRPSAYEVFVRLAGRRAAPVRVLRLSLILNCKICQHSGHIVLPHTSAAYQALAAPFCVQAHRSCMLLHAAFSNIYA